MASLWNQNKLFATYAPLFMDKVQEKTKYKNAKRNNSLNFKSNKNKILMDSYSICSLNTKEKPIKPIWSSN